MHFTLSHLKAGESATIAELDAHTELYHRLVAMGFRVGKQVEVLRSAAFSGPLHVKIGMTDIILRRREGERVRLIPNQIAVAG